MLTALAVAAGLASVLHTHPAATDDTEDPAATLAAQPASDPPEAPWVSLRGSGLFALPDTATLEPRQLDLQAAFDNQDRDPLRLDVLDLSIRWTYGVRQRLETYGSIVVSRAVIVADRPSLFVPPVDIVVPEGMPVPSRPYYPVYAPIPYVNRTGSSQIDQFVPGDLGLGAKLRVAAARRFRPAIAVSGELKLPLTKDVSSLQSGAGTGGFDQTLRVTGEWRRRSESLVASLAFTHVGHPPLGDRVIVAGADGSGQSRDEPLRLPDQLCLGLGFRHVLSSRAALLAEVTRAVAIGARSRAFYEAGPLDVTLGAQLRWRRMHLTLGVRYHANSVPPVTARSWPLGGLADMTSVDRAALLGYLTAIGAGGAASQLRDRSQIAVQVPVNGPALPDGARILDSAYLVRSHDKIASVFIWGWSFGKGRSR